MSTYRVDIFRKTKTDRNPTIAVAVYQKNSGWPTRALTHRGISGHAHLTRDMTAQEIEYTDRSWREQLYNYETVEGLIRDELEATGDNEWIEKITELFKYQMQIPCQPQTLTT